jgi:hypothetical protein
MLVCSRYAMSVFFIMSYLTFIFFFPHQINRNRSADEDTKTQLQTKITEFENRKATLVNERYALFSIDGVTKELSLCVLYLLIVGYPFERVYLGIYFNRSFSSPPKE